MYYYLYDSFLIEKKYQKILSHLETRLTDLGLNGKIGRLTILQNFKESIIDEIKRGAKTVVVVGNDQTISAAINAMANSQIVLGILPIGPNNTIAPTLGIPLGEEACNVLSARKIEKLDLGKINNQYFLCSVKIPAHSTTIRCEEKYNIIPLEKNSSITVYNLKCPAPLQKTTSFFNPQDGILETVVENESGFLTSFTKKEKKIPSIFSTKKITINSQESIPLLVDGQTIINTPATIEIIPQKLKIIVSKERKF